MRRGWVKVEGVCLGCVVNGGASGRWRGGVVSVGAGRGGVVGGEVRW